MVYHIIDHQGFGTIHKLLGPLCKFYGNHQLVLYDDCKKLSQIANEKNSHIIIHSTASKKSNFINVFPQYFENRRVYIFMHVSLEYEIYKGRSDLINILRSLTSSHNVIVLTPSIEVTNQYLQAGIRTKTVQLGVDSSQLEQYRQHKINLEKYYRKIITTCSSDNDVYKYIKGIDLFEKFITKNQLEKDALIAGTNNSKGTHIICHKFEEYDFLNTLAHAKIYIQFSRFESYNITAVYAKLLKIPVLLLNSEGTCSCMKGYVFDNENQIEDEALKILMKGTDCKLLEELYNDSILRENLESFRNSIESIIGGVC